MKYTDLVFDLYGTLVDIHTDENWQVWEKTALFFGYYGAHYSARELRHAFDEQIAQRKIKAGQSYECFPDIPFEGIMASLFQMKGIHEHLPVLAVQAAQLLRICSTEYIQCYPHVKESLELLKSKGYRLWLLSNAQAVFTEYELAHLGLKDVFDGIYISSAYGYRKPDIRFYSALLQEQNLIPGKCLMIGNDRDTDIAGAQLAGMDTLYMHTALTPSEQAPADPALSPAVPARHMEFEGEDWQTLVHFFL